MKKFSKPLRVRGDGVPVLNASEIDGFIRKLESFSSTLSKRDADVLMAALCSTIDPFERMKFVKEETILSEEELGILAKLKSGNSKK